MTDPNNRYYFFHKGEKTIFYSETWPVADAEFDYLGLSNNLNRKMAAGIFMKRWKDIRGCKIREYTGD